MKISVLLADKGTPNPQQGTLNLLNVGWTQTVLRPAGSVVPGGFLTPAHALAVFFEVEPRHCNHPIDLVLELLDEDGNPVQVPGPAGPQAMRITQQVIVQSPGGMPVGSPGTGNALIEIVPGLAIAPGGYEWRVGMAGESNDDWVARFQVLSLPMSGPVFGQPVPPSA